MAYYVIGNDKSLEEAYTKNEVDSTVNAMSQNINDNQSRINSLTSLVSVNTSSITTLAKYKQDKITYGTAAPSGGSNGDIYIQY